MKFLNTNHTYTKIFLIAISLIANNCFSEAQILVPRRTNLPNRSEINRSNIRTLNIGASQTISATQTQAINFGTYYVNGNAGGTVTIGWDGTRSSTGDVVLLNIAPMAQPAIFEIKLAEGNAVSFNFAPTGMLTGSNGGSLIFDIGPTEKGVNGSSFSVTNNSSFFIPFKVGGTLHIPANAIQGTYSGNFDITFQQE